LHKKDHNKLLRERLVRRIWSAEKEINEALWGLFYINSAKTITLFTDIFAFFTAQEFYYLIFLVENKLFLDLIDMPLSFHVLIGFKSVCIFVISTYISYIIIHVLYCCMIVRCAGKGIGLFSFAGNGIITFYNLVYGLRLRQSIFVYS